MTRPPVLRYGRIAMGCTTMADHPTMPCPACGGDGRVPLPPHPWRTLITLRREGERAENAERERDAARAEVQRLTEENARLREVPAKGHATMDDLLPCVCGHSIEEHEPDCVECECLHYEADVEEDGDKEGSRG